MDDEQYRCPKCRELMTDACQTVNCGHRFCERCVKELLNEEERIGRPATCPKDGCGLPLRGEDGVKYFPDRFIQRKVRNLVVKCPMKTCKWEGKVESQEDHMQRCHPPYVVKPVKSSEATHMMVDKKHMEATQSTQRYVEKLLGDISGAVGLLGDAIQSQQNMETVVRENVEINGNHQSAAQSTASLGPADQSTLKERSLTMNAERPSFHSIHMVDPEVDTNSLSQADQAMIFYSGCNTNDHAQVEGHDDHPTMHHHTKSTATSGDQSAAAACAQTGTEKSSKRRKKSIECKEPFRFPLIKGAQSMSVEPTRQAVTMPKSSMSLPPMMVSQYTQTMADDVPPPVPPKRKHKSATIPQQRSKQDTLPPLGHVYPPLATSLSSCTSTHAIREETPTCKNMTMTANDPELCCCSMCEMQRQLAVERDKSRTMKKIWATEFQLDISTQVQDPSNLNESRKRLHSVPAIMKSTTNRK